jgi:translocation and assembly module TamB
VTFDLGDKVTVVGKGLDARVAGSIRLRGSGANLNADGTIRITQGEYQAYGRRLQIERGTLFFAGPVDNPALNIRAMRKNQVVEAGVEVTGTARNPQVTLVSNPDVAENEKLSWLVLGHGTDSTKGGDITLLQAAQAALGAVLADKSGADSLKRQFTKATGLDEIRIKGGAEAASQTLELGARLSERVYVTYEQGLAAASRALRLNFVLTPRWTLRAENGATSAVDLFYTLSFD